MGRRADQGKHREWSERIRRRRESRLTVAEFCEWEGVSVASFYNWQKKLRVEKSRSRSTAVIAPQIKSMPPVLRDSFLPVHITQPTLGRLAPTCIEICMANGVRIFVPISDANTIHDVIKTAGSISILATTDVNDNRELMEDATC